MNLESFVFDSVFELPEEDRVKAVKSIILEKLKYFDDIFEDYKREFK